MNSYICYHKKKVRKWLDGGVDFFERLEFQIDIKLKKVRPARVSLSLKADTY